MKLNGYNIVCELFGFGSRPDPKDHLAFCADHIIKYYKEIIKKYNKEDNANYRVFMNQDMEIGKRIVKDSSSRIASKVNCSVDIHNFHGLVIALYYSKQNKRYDYFSFWLIDTDAGLMTSIIIQFMYKGGRMDLPSQSGGLKISSLKQQLKP